MLTVREFEAEARRRLDPVRFDFFAGGVCDEVTLRRNEAAFARIALVPRVLRGTATRAADLVLLGCPSSIPILIAPTAFHRLAHRDGELATARATAGAGVIMIVSMASTVAIAEIVAALGGRIPVLLDGGVRRGSDVVKALALGASAVAIGRPMIWGLAADGEAGVARVLEMLRNELDETLALCGCRSLQDMTLDLVRVPNSWEGRCSC